MPLIQFRRGSTAEWTAANPTLADGEPGYALPDGPLKIGNGITPWADLPESASDSATRTGAFQFDHAGALSPLGAATFTARQGFALPFDGLEFRVHYRNRNFLGEVDAVGTIDAFKAYVGEAVMGPDGPTGAFVAPPVQILAPTTLVDGVEKVTPWITPATFALTKNKRYLLSTGFTMPSAETPIALGGGGHFVSYDGDRAAQQAANAVFTPNQSFFDTWIEYRFVDDNAPTILVVSNSLSGPGNVVAATNRGDLDAWQHQWAFANGGVAASIAVGGSWAANYPASSAKWTHYDTAATPMVYDAIVLMGLLSSDVAGGAGDAAAIEVAKGSYGVVVNKARSLYPNARIIGTTSPPRQASSGDQETARLSVNAWLSSSPYQIEQCYDIDMFLRNGGTPQRLKPEYDSGDGDHWTPRAHGAVASGVPVRSRTR
ncbi:hypothetical protein [Rhodococcus sp. I2R]|uniref:hyaluronate lyase N-terminal domain-containing protein n=1 Tax=Rhodococcus sp. I2R TaxID=2855445 RepID=UPI001E3535F2|nr:hypothetical protein [Rhodococcus sp. I2R]MCC8930837.1 hypothetical protein [Rhodococcus sp. I2R]